MSFPLSHVCDPTNKYAILDAITFKSDKDEAKKILDNTPSAPPPATVYGGNYPAPVSQPAAAPYQPPPQQQQQVPYQPPNPGGYPTAAPMYPSQGGYPPPPQGTYPPPPSQGVYPAPAQGGYPLPPGSGYGQPPPGGINFQFGVGAPGAPPVSQQQVPPPGEVNVQFGLGGFGMPTGNISFQTNPSQQPPPWP